MKKSIFLTITFILPLFFCKAQTGFIKNFYGLGSMPMSDLDTTHDQGYIMCGRDYFNSGENFVVLKTDSLGNEEWRYTNTDCNNLDNQNYNLSYQVKETPQHDFLVLAWIAGLISPNSSDIILAKIDSGGSLIWKRQYNLSFGESAFSMNFFEDSTYLIAGRITGGVNQIIKANYFGDTIWTKRIPVLNNGSFTAQEIIKMNDNYFFAGRNDSTTAVSWAEVMCTDLLGNLKWQKLYKDSARASRITDFRLTSNNQLLLASHNSQTASVPDITFTVFVIDTLGNQIEKYFHHSVNRNFASSIFFNDSCLINYSIGSNIDSINLYKYDLLLDQNNNVVNYLASKASLIKCVLTRKKEVVFVAVYSDAGTVYSVLVKTNQSFIGINGVSQSEDFFVYPNPANESIIIQAKKLNFNTNWAINFELFDINGKSVFQQNFHQSDFQISTITLGSGPFTYKIRNAGNSVKIGKIMITH